MKGIRLIGPWFACCLSFWNTFKDCTTVEHPHWSDHSYTTDSLLTTRVQTILKILVKFDHTLCFKPYVLLVSFVSQGWTWCLLFSLPVDALLRWMQCRNISLDDSWKISSKHTTVLTVLHFQWDHYHFGKWYDDFWLILVEVFDKAERVQRWYMSQFSTFFLWKTWEATPKNAAKALTYRTEILQRPWRFSLQWHFLRKVFFKGILIQECIDTIMLESDFIWLAAADSAVDWWVLLLF